MKVVLVTDGNSELGMGHIYQSLTLAGFLEERVGRQGLSFLTKSEGAAFEHLVRSGYPVRFCQDDEAIFAALRAERPERIVFDKLDVSPLLAQRIKRELAAKLVICTNLTSANEVADVTVLADIGSDFKNIHRRDGATGRVEFFGPKYWILRPEFYRLRRDPPPHAAKIESILLIFGGADPANFSTLVLAELLRMGEPFTIRLILGGAFPHRTALDGVLAGAASSRAKVTILQDVKTVAELMRTSDLVFASPGLSFFEALAVGSPVLGFHQNEPQRAAYAGLLPTYGVDGVGEVPRLVRQHQFIFPDDPFVASMAIGRGKDDILNEILN